MSRIIANDKNLEKTYIEFGVFSGSSINFLSKRLNDKEIYGFDSFEGLKEDWGGTLGEQKGLYTQNKKIPKLYSNIEPVVGWVEDTLDDFLKSLPTSA